jgi:hypothetical protein
MYLTLRRKRGRIDEKDGLEKTLGEITYPLVRLRRCFITM